MTPVLPAPVGALTTCKYLSSDVRQQWCRDTFSGSPRQAGRQAGQRRDSEAGVFLTMLTSDSKAMGNTALCTELKYLCQTQARFGRWRDSTRICVSHIAHLNEPL